MICPIAALLWPSRHRWGSTTAYRLWLRADYIDEDQEIYLRGSIIFVAPGMGVEIQAGGKQYLVIEQKDVIAILE